MGSDVDTPQAGAAVRMAGDGAAIADGTLFATRDGAPSWAPVELPVASVTDVVASESSVWVTGRSGSAPDARTVVATSPAEVDDFRDARLPRPLSAPATISETALVQSDDGRRFGFLRSGAGDAQFVAYEESQQQWQTFGTDGCTSAYSLSEASDIMWAVCSRDDGNLPMVSADAGESWDVVEVDMDLGGKPRIAAIDSDTALVSTGIELYVLDSGRLNRADPPTEGAGSATYDYLGFHDDSTGFLIDEDGRLSFTDSGGASWRPVELP